MLLTLIFAFLSLAGAGVTYYFTYWWKDLWTLFVPFLLAIAYFAACFILVWVFAFVVSRFFSPKKVVKHVQPLTLWILEQSCDYLLVLQRVHIRIEGEEKMPKGQRYLVVCNHRSAYDHLAIFSHFSHERMISMSKKELEAKPIIGRWMHQAGFIAIDREDPIQGLRCVLQAIAYLKDGEASVVLSPEGTRSKDGKLGEFHSGSFKIATKSLCPVVVMSVVGANLIKKNFPLHSTTVTIKVIDVLYKEDYQALSASELSDKVHAEIAASLGE